MVWIHWGRSRVYTSAESLARMLTGLYQCHTCIGFFHKRLTLEDPFSNCSNNSQPASQSDEISIVWSWSKIINQGLVEPDQNSLLGFWKLLKELFKNIGPIQCPMSKTNIGTRHSSGSSANGIVFSKIETSWPSLAKGCLLVQKLPITDTLPIIMI